MNARLAVLIGALVWCSAAEAENFRCGQWVASPDMSVEELFEKCGAPTIVDGRIKSMVRGE